MDFLIMCEESQAVCIELRKRGHNAFSCDILPPSGGHPEWHIVGDCRKVAEHYGKWDRIISFPPCTDLSLSGARHFEKKRLSGEQEFSINFFLDVWELSNCVENPKNIMSGWKYITRWFPKIVERMQDIKFPLYYSQAIQPYQFGHGETKETWLWLRGLPLLKPTHNVTGRSNRIHRMSPGPERAKLRSKTYPGIAKAMAEQWS